MISKLINLFIYLYLINKLLVLNYTGRVKIKFCPRTS